MASPANPRLTRQPTPVRIFLGALLAAVAVLAGPVACIRKAVAPGRPPPVVATTSSRVLLPRDSGQTIHLPPLLVEARILWQPLSVEELRAAAPLAEVLERDEPLIGKLSPADQEVSRRYLYRLTHEHPEMTRQVLLRAEEQLPVIVAELRRQGLPLELAGLPMVESGFQADAVSPAGAAGLWQLMPETARRYGLTVNNRLDERFSVDKSTVAACQYLAFLHDRFKDWQLAVAAYNSGEGAMARAMAQSGCSCLAELSAHFRLAPQTDQGLKAETIQFVPQWIAAVAVMRGSAPFGLQPMQLLFPVSAGSDRADNRPREQLSLSGSYLQPQPEKTAPPQSKKITPQLEQP